LALSFLGAGESSGDPAPAPARARLKLCLGPGEGTARLALAASGRCVEVALTNYEQTIVLRSGHADVDCLRVSLEDGSPDPPSLAFALESCAARGKSMEAWPLRGGSIVLKCAHYKRISLAADRRPASARARSPEPSRAFLRPRPVPASLKAADPRWRLEVQGGTPTAPGGV